MRKGGGVGRPLRPPLATGLLFVCVKCVFVCIDAKKMSHAH